MKKEYFHFAVKSVMACFFGICIVFVSAAVSFADGKHGVKVQVTNNYTDDIGAYSYNGDDAICYQEHKDYHDKEPGTTFTAKAHGNGTGKLRLMVFRLPGSKWKGVCKNLEQSSCITSMFRVFKVQNGQSVVVNEDKTCTISD